MSKDLLLYKERHSVLEKARMEIHTEPYLTGWYDAIWLEGMELYLHSSKDRLSDS